MRVGVHFDNGGSGCSRFQNHVHIQIGARSIRQQSPRRVGDHVNVRVPDGVEQAICHLFAWLAEARVHAGNDKIQLGQDFVRIVQRAIGLDLHFSAMQDAKIGSDGLICRSYRLALFPQPLNGQSIGDAQAARMIGDDNVAQAAIPRRLRHLQDAQATV